MGFSSKPIDVTKPELKQLLNEVSAKLAAAGKEMSKVNTENVDLEAKVNQEVEHMTPKQEVIIPQEISQAGYTITGYGKEGWVYPGLDTVGIADGTSQKAVHDMWVDQNCNYKHDIASLNVNGKDRYLIATADTFGNVGDIVTVELENGDKFDCVIADAKSSDDPNFSKYGHMYGNQTNIVEFEVNMVKYNADGNPTTKTWNLDWDSSSPVKKISNFGSIIEK